MIRALIWPAGATEPMDLNAFVDIPGVTLIHAYRINNAGQILAEGLSDTGNYAYYVLTPVPEPQAVTLVGLGVMALAMRRTRGHYPCFIVLAVHWRPGRTPTIALFASG